MTAMLLLLPPLKALADINVPLQRGLAAAESVFALIDAPEEKDAGTLTLDRAHGHLVFDRVSLQYAGAERPSLDNVSLEIRAGEAVALVG